MKNLVKKIFLNNWQRKCISLILACILWVVVNHSLIETKTFDHVPIKILNMPKGKTIEGLQSNQTLSKKISLRITGNRKILSALSDGDLQAVIDAQDKNGDWIVTIAKKNLVTFNPDINLIQGIQKICHKDLVLHITNAITEKIPIIITNPTGEAPHGYEFLDIWPYELLLTVTGPEKEVKQLKNKGIKLSFNLNNISKNELDLRHETKKEDEVSFLIPDDWKKISIPSLSNTPLTIDDPRARFLRIDFAPTLSIHLQNAIPVALFFPQNTLAKYNPSNLSIQPNNFIHNVNSLFFIEQDFYAAHVSQLFADIVKNMVQIVIVASPSGKSENFSWHVQFVSPHELENRYVAHILSQIEEEEVQPDLMEEYLRNRFRHYMASFRLFLANQEKLSLKIYSSNNKVYLEPKSQKNSF